MDISAPAQNAPGSFAILQRTWFSHPVAPYSSLCILDNCSLSETWFAHIFHKLPFPFVNGFLHCADVFLASFPSPLVYFACVSFAWGVTLWPLRKNAAARAPLSWGFTDGTGGQVRGSGQLPPNKTSNTLSCHLLLSLSKLSSWLIFFNQYWKFLFLLFMFTQFSKPIWISIILPSFYIHHLSNTH